MNSMTFGDQCLIRGEVELAMTTNEWMRVYGGGCLYQYFCVILMFFL